MTPVEFVREVHRRDAALSAAGWLMIVALPVAAGLALVDTRTILGVNPWIKPIKFLSSIGIFLWTMAWFVPEVDRAHTRRLAWLRWTMIGAMAVEIILIAMQAARGTTSHFNVATTFDAAVFETMGILIVLNTLAVTMFLWSLSTNIDPARVGYLRGMRLGMMVFVVGSLIGFVMTTHNGHAVPGPDGGPGLPLVNWSTTMGDIRIAHFIGLHALQGLPLAGFLLDRARSSNPTRDRLVSIGALVWAVLMAAALWLAAAGRPVIAL